MDGSITSEAWGIQEIKIGADYLSSPYISEYVEKGLLAPEQEYFSHHSNANNTSYTVWAESKRKNNSDFLAYKFGLQKPRLALIADFNSHDFPDYLRAQNIKNRAMSNGVLISTLNDAEELKNFITEHSALLLIIKLPTDEEKKRKIFKYISECYPSMPARILLRGDNIANQDLEKYKIPERRCFVANWVEYPDEVSSNNDFSWEKFVIDVYKEWLIRFGGLKEKKVNLAIYFDRPKEHKAVTQWERIKTDLNNWELNALVEIWIFNQEDIKARNFKGEFRKLNDDKSVILFDNHGKLKDKLRILDRAILHYHPIGNDRTRSTFNNRYIFDALQNVSIGFGGAFSLLLLIESAMSKGLIIDERVADSLISNYNVEKKMLEPTFTRSNCLQRGGCYVPFFIRSSNGKAQCLIKRFNDAKRIKDDTSAEEGLRIEDGDLKLMVLHSDSHETKPVNSIDFIIIHKGVLETFFKNNSKQFISSCKCLSPRVVITSGRGSVLSNSQRGDIPFLEYSVISQFIVREFSKYHLNRILFSLQ